MFGSDPPGRGTKKSASPSEATGRSQTKSTSASPRQTTLRLALIGVCVISGSGEEF